MAVVIREENVEKIIRAYGLKRRIKELERQIGELQRRKAKLEEEYEKMDISIE